MVKKITTKGAAQAAIDFLLMAVYFVGGIAGIMYASVLTDLTMWFFFAVSMFLLFSSLELVNKITKPLDNYDTQVV